MAVSDVPDPHPLKPPLAEPSAVLSSPSAWEQAEKELLARIAELTRVNQRKDEFLAFLAHELRSPLAPIRNALVLLSMGDTDAESAEHARQIMERQVEQMVRLVDDLLDVSRIMSHKLELRKEPVELVTVVNRAVETAQPAIYAKAHELTISLPPEPVWLEADPIRLAQAITNVLNNAAKYTEPGGHIWLAAEQQGDHVAIRVRDNGIGIGNELLPRVFDLFAQAETSIDRSQGGLGIGLTLVKTLVELHGGNVEAASGGPHRGSEFTLRLPVMARHSKPEPAPRLTKVMPELRILVVEDVVGSAKILATMLRKFWGHQVEIAHDGLTALDLARQFHPDLIFLDIGLPKLSGYEVAKQLREDTNFERTLLVALTGYGQEEDRQQTEAAGFDEYLLKPASVADLERIFAHPKLVAGR
jgi:CheY-like chemotaxis protein/nitrogen-specific signal transduction histidine kinase